MKRFWSEPIGHRTRSQVASGYYPDTNKPASKQCSTTSSSTSSDDVRVLEDIAVASSADDSDEIDSGYAHLDSSEEESGDETVVVPDSNIIDYDDSDDEGQEGYDDEEEEEEDDGDNPVIVVDYSSDNTDNDHDGLNAEEETGDALQNCTLQGEEEERDATPVTIIVDEDDHETKKRKFDYVQGTNCIAKRTRSKIGGENIPVVAEVNGDATDDNAGDVGKMKVEISSDKLTRKVECRKNSKRNCVQADTLLQLFSSTIWGASENAQNQEPIFPKEIVKPLLQKFNFGVEKEVVEEKSDNDKLMDALWDEFDLALASARIGSPAPPVDTEDSDKPMERNSSFGCCQGAHDFVLDEQVGIKCRFCSFVQVEIRYVVPTIDTSRSERLVKKNYDDDRELSRWTALPLEDSGGDSQDFIFQGKNTVWDIFPQIRDSMFPHQEEGFEFLWTHVAGGIEINDSKKSIHNDDLGGCMISHAPGTGKTYLTIAFLRTYMEVFKECRPIIIAPCSMLLTWEEELKKWKIDFPFHNLNSLKFSDEEQDSANQMIEGKIQGNINKRMVKLLLWCKKRSMLGISYPLFETLTGERLIECNDNKKQAGKVAGWRRQNYLEKLVLMRQVLLERPSLLVLDEGHTPRNKNSKIWKALVKVKTQKRIILSGTPFQNNFEELYDNLCLVRPKFADRGFWDSLTSSVGLHDDKHTSDKIRALLDPFVHVHRGSMLKESLPGLRSWVVNLNPLPLQSDVLKGCQKIQNHLKFEHVVSLVSVHPSLWTDCSSSTEEKCTINKIASNDFRIDPNQGVKTRFLLKFIVLCEALKEKILVFSQYIDPLLLIKDQLNHCLQWTEGEEVLYINGKLPAKQRQSYINLFNDPHSKAKVLLATTKTCREGINLIGASRVVLLDVVWNPSVERQAIGRAYRVGQERVVYTYHLISGNMEEDKHDRQVQKDMLSELVFSSTQNHGDRQHDSRTIQEDRVLKEMVENANLGEMFKKIRRTY